MRDQRMLPSVAAIKDRARRLRQETARAGGTITHSQSLELIATRYGFRDWNSLRAAVGNRPGLMHLEAGERVSGVYLGQAFFARLLGIRTLEVDPSLFHVTLDFEQAVDVVTFESFSAYRSRVRATVGEDGMSRERTSNGTPQLELAW